MSDRTLEGNRKSRAAAYLREQNKVRGVVGSSSRRGKEPIDGPAIYREGVRRVLLESRRTIDGDDRLSFLNWVSGLRPGGISRKRNPVAYDLVRPLVKSKPICFASELDWTIARLAPHIGELKDFRSRATDLNDAFWKGLIEKVASQLDEIEGKFGESIWSIELKLAVFQYAKGLEGQKSYLKGIKEHWKSGLPAYLAHFYSIRNEDRSTMRLYRDDALTRISETKLFDQALTYLRFKIADVFPTADTDLSAITRSEQLQSVIDIYETTIALFQRLILSSKHERYRDAMLRCVDAWLPIDDFRLTKIAIALGRVPPANLPIRNIAAISYITAGGIPLGLRAAHRTQKGDPTDIFAGVEYVFAASVVSREAESPAETPWKSLSKALTDAIQRSADFESSSGFLEKFCRNFRGLHGAAALGDFVAFGAGINLGSDLTLAGAALNTPTFGPEDLLLSAGDAKRWLRSIIASSPRAALLAPWLSEETKGRGHGLGLSAAYLSSLRHIASSPAEALESLRSIETARLRPALRALVHGLRIEVALREGERALAIIDMANEAACGPAARSVLPVEAAIANRDWPDLASTNQTLDLAIALDLMWRKTDNDLYGSFLRFAFEEVLAEQGCDRPSSLSVPEGQSPQRLVYFLRHVAVPQVMDLTGIWELSREVIEERIAVCGILQSLDPDNFQLYGDEIAEIRNQILIQDGLRIVDNSRINVDTVAISRWAEKRYRESFSRYTALVEAGIGIANDFDEVLRKALQHPDGVGDFFNVPDNEADTLLLEIVIEIRNQFLNNPEHGLEFFLGKRIRHGTVSGHLRGPVETAKLITQRESEAADYKRNDEWFQRLSFSSPDCSDELDKTFKAFAKSYDEIAKKLKDDYLHVKSKKYPNGVFELRITDFAYNIIRSAIKSDLTFEGLLSICYALFWALLEASLAHARSLLSPGGKDEAAKLFDVLQNQARTYVLHDDAYEQLSVAIRSAASEVQRQFDTIADWFRRTEIEQAHHRYSLAEVVAVGVQSSLKAHNAFEPLMSYEIQGGVAAPITLLVILTDIIFVIIDNACRRSASGRRPTIHIRCFYDRPNDALVLEAINSIGPSINRDAVEVKLENIRFRVKAGDIQSGALAEDGSGLLKIANITQQSQKSDLEFGFYGVDKFRTLVRLSVISDGGSLALTPAVGN